MSALNDEIYLFMWEAGQIQEINKGFGSVSFFYIHLLHGKA
jgi:hypothetical protein